MEEVWKEIPDFPDYKISTLGNIMSKKSGDWVQLCPCPNTYGYMVIDLSKNNKRFQRRVNRLMGLTFLPNPDNLPTIDHIDMVRTNNHLSNLRWATYKTQSMNRITTRRDITEIDPVERQKLVAASNIKKNMDTKKYYCETCHMSFQCKSALKEHANSPTHLRILNFKPTSELCCIPCGLNFKDKWDRNRHINRPPHKKRMENIATHISSS
jgi:hypothetical protein